MTGLAPPASAGDAIVAGPGAPGRALAHPARAPSLVLFDLDGTLAHTLPDLAGALNATLAEAAMPAIDEAALLPVVSAGTQAMLALATRGLPPGPPDLRERFLARYQRDLGSATRLFDGIPELLARLDDAGIRWGIVTNKLARFTLPLVERLALRERAACIVSGDASVHPKPHPAPLIHACRETAIVPARTVYVGDAPGDALAARRAGMRAIAALWGYLPASPPPRLWGAALADSPAAVGALLLDAAPAVPVARPGGAC